MNDKSNNEFESALNDIRQTLSLRKETDDVLQLTEIADGDSVKAFDSKDTKDLSSEKKTQKSALILDNQDDENLQTYDSNGKFLNLDNPANTSDRDAAPEIIKKNTEKHSLSLANKQKMRDMFKGLKNAHDKKQKQLHDVANGDKASNHTISTNQSINSFIMDAINNKIDDHLDENLINNYLSSYLDTLNDKIDEMISSCIHKEIVEKKLSEWLNKNLNAIASKIIEKEIKRIYENNSDTLE